MLRWQGFFREASGAGWVLLGDAGWFKDPAAGQGIGDAFRQGEALAPAIVRGLDGTEPALDRALFKDWWRWRDFEDAVGHYWLATDMGKAGGRPPPCSPEIGKQLLARGDSVPLIDLFSHRGRTTQVFTPARLMAAMGRLLARPRMRPARRCSSEIRWTGRTERPSSTRVPLASCMSRTARRATREQPRCRIQPRRDRDAHERAKLDVGSPNH